MNQAGGSVPADTVYAQIDVRDDNSNRIGARIEFKSVGTPNTGKLPTDMIFKTTRDNAQEADDDAGERMRITSTGNVGIGTTSPTSKLHVVGKATITGGVDPPYVSFSGESHESIREYANNVGKHEKAMVFWNDDNRRMEVYVIGEDKFYAIGLEPIN